MHVIAAKAICFGEALKPSFKEYQAQVIQMPRLWPVAYANSAFTWYGGSDNHLMLVDLLFPPRPHRQAGSDCIGRSQRHP